jgi:uncharacterized membrane protein
MVRVLAAAALAWPLYLGVVVWHRAVSGAAVWTTTVYLAASRICHQRPERSFFTAGVQWPVCGRCSGLYLGAAAAALAVLVIQRRLRLGRLRAPVLLAVASIPTALTLGGEWFHLADVTNVARLASALPLGAAVFLAIASAVAARDASSPLEPPSSIH